jgi:IS5 family transposase
MVRVLPIQQLFNLSDEQMEFQLLDRLSFQRFAGLRASSQIPDHTTIWIFTEHPMQAGASESIFEAVNQQLAKHGYIARGGQIQCNKHNKLVRKIKVSTAGEHDTLHLRTCLIPPIRIALSSPIRDTSMASTRRG